VLLGFRLRAPSVAVCVGEGGSGGALSLAHADRLLMLGDSVNDTQAARAAGCPVFCVPYGYNEGRPVQSLDCDGIVSSLDELPERIRLG